MTIARAAASARLCVETTVLSWFGIDVPAAASARLCVETLLGSILPEGAVKQPPPRGCVLKPLPLTITTPALYAAASARLCVETLEFADKQDSYYVAAASARLCVETDNKDYDPQDITGQPPPRGCVLKHQFYPTTGETFTEAASARRCVETG